MLLLKAESQEWIPREQIFKSMFLNFRGKEREWNERFYDKENPSIKRSTSSKEPSPIIPREFKVVLQWI